MVESWVINASPVILLAKVGLIDRVPAKELNIPMLGTVGVVLRLKKAGLISEVRPHLLKIKNVGGFIGDELFREALLRAEEQT